MLQVTLQLSTLLFCLGLDQAYVREYHESTNKPNLLLNATAPGLMLLSLALLVLSLFFPTALSNVLYGEDKPILALVTAGCLLIAYLSRFLSLILRMQDRGLAFSMSQLLSKGLLLAIVITYAFLPVTRNFTMLLLAQAAALLLTLLVFAWNTREDWLPALQRRLEYPLLKQLLGFGWPLIFGGIASWGLNTMDRIFLRSMSTYEELAIYSVAASIASGAAIVAGIFNTIWAPLVFKWVADGVDTTRVDVIARQVSAVLVSLICLLGAFSWILPYLLPDDYAKVMYLVAGCMVAPLLYTLSEVTGVGITVSRRTGFALMASSVAVGVNLILCALLVRPMGAVGAMISTSCAFWVFYIVRSEFSAIAWRPIRRGRVYLYSTIAFLATVIFGLIGSQAPAYAIGSWVVLLILFIFLERPILLEVWALLRR